MIERSVTTRFSCKLCGASEQLEGAVGASNFEEQHKQCEILYEALLKFMHLGTVRNNLQQTIEWIADEAYKTFKESNKTEVVEKDYDKFYR